MTWVQVPAASIDDVLTFAEDILEMRLRELRTAILVNCDPDLDDLDALMAEQRAEFEASRQQIRRTLQNIIRCHGTRNTTHDT